MSHSRKKSKDILRYEYYNKNISESDIDTLQNTVDVDEFVEIKMLMHQRNMFFEKLNQINISQTLEQALQLTF